MGRIHEVWGWSYPTDDEKRSRWCTFLDMEGDRIRACLRRDPFAKHKWVAQLSVNKNGMENIGVFNTMKKAREACRQAMITYDSL